MRSLVFDSSSVITLALNNLLWVLKPLRKQFKGEFYIPLAVKKEIIDIPLKSKKFKLEALQVLKVIDDGDLKVYDDSKLLHEVKKVMRLVNGIYRTKKKNIKLLHEGEVAALVLAKKLGSDALVIDERTTRMVLEEPLALEKLFNRKLHRKVEVFGKMLNEFSRNFKDVAVIRSVELGVIAYEMGLFDKYITINGRIMKDMRKDLFDGFLWALKLRGCSVSVSEINSLLHSQKL